jgi:hypothetical protein
VPSRVVLPIARANETSRVPQGACNTGENFWLAGLSYASAAGTTASSTSEASCTTDVPTRRPTFKPTTSDAPTSTVYPTNPTAVPTPSPTRVPIVVTGITLGGIDCDNDFDETIFQNGMDKTIGEGDGTFSDSECTDSSDGSTVYVSTEVMVPRSVAAALGKTVHEHIIAKLTNASGAVLEANILSFVDRRRRLGASAHRRLSMADMTVEAVSVETFSPTPAPSPRPTPAPVAAPVAPVPTTTPTPRPSTVIIQRKKAKSDDDTMLIIILVLASVVFVAGSLLILVVLRKKKMAEPAQAPPSNDAAITAIPISSPSSGAGAEGVEMTESPAANKHSITI